MKKFLIAVAGSVVISAAVCFTLMALLDFGLTKQTVSVVQELKSPDSNHTARLVRNMFIDLNFKVLVDGKLVYVSTDFPASETIPYRETLLWDESSRFVILEVLGHRLFGYDTQNETQLTGQELLSIPIPEPWIVQHLENSGFWPEDETKATSNRVAGS
jgi:hypothetical protein